MNMKCIHIITPVKDSIDSTLDTVRAIMSSDIKVPFTQYTTTSVHRKIHSVWKKRRRNMVFNWLT